MRAWSKPVQWFSCKAHYSIKDKSLLLLLRLNFNKYSERFNLFIYKFQQIQTLLFTRHDLQKIWDMRNFCFDKIISVIYLYNTRYFSKCIYYNKKTISIFTLDLKLFQYFTTLRISQGTIEFQIISFLRIEFDFNISDQTASENQDSINLSLKGYRVSIMFSNFFCQVTFQQYWTCFTYRKETVPWMKKMRKENVLNLRKRILKNGCSSYSFTFKKIPLYEYRKI